MLYMLILCWNWVWMERGRRWTEREREKERERESVSRSVLNWKRTHALKHMLLSTASNHLFSADARQAPVGVYQTLVHVQLFSVSVRFRSN